MLLTQGLFNFSFKTPKLNNFLGITSEQSVIFVFACIATKCVLCSYFNQVNADNDHARGVDSKVIKQTYLPRRCFPLAANQQCALPFNEWYAQHIHTTQHCYRF